MHDTYDPTHGGMWPSGRVDVVDDYGRKLIEQGAREERAIISAELHAIEQASLLPGRIGLACTWLEDRMRQDKKQEPEQRPKKIERLRHSEYTRYDGWAERAQDKLNEIIDAVNAHVEKP